MYEVASESSLGSWLLGWVGRWEHRKFGTTPVPTHHLTQRPCSHSYRLVPIPVRPERSDTRSQESHDYLLSIFYGDSELSTTESEGVDYKSCQGDEAGDSKG